MKKSLLFCVLSSIGLVASAQVTTYTSVATGDYNNSATWGGALSAPPTSGTCNCKIVIAANTTVKFTADMTLQNANFVLSEANGHLTFSNGRTVNLTGPNSSINITTSQASIFRGNSGNKIQFNGVDTYAGNAAGINSSTTGTVAGVASTTSSTAPVWSNSVLPVALSDFKASVKDNKVNLSWTTTREVNSSHFEIERSSDSRTWNKVASISAAGNTGVSQNYSYTDHSPTNGNNYYRLKIIDIDGQFEFSPIKNVSVAVSGMTVTAGPNPAYSTLNVMIAQAAAKDFEVKLINRSGQVIYNRKYAAGLDRISIDVSKFAEGNYFVEITDAAGAKTIKNILVLRK